MGNGPGQALGSYVIKLDVQHPRKKERVDMTHPTQQTSPSETEQFFLEDELLQFLT